MLVAVSPAKKLNEDAPRTIGGSTPEMIVQAGKLADIARRLTGRQLEKLMHISSKLGALNQARFAAFGTGEGEKQAIEVFAGDTYLGFDGTSLDPEEMDYAQDHLCILSGLYGLLRPRDVIQPHRLEMGSRLAGPYGRDLYAFWGDRIAGALNARADETGSEMLVNCASVEYFTAANRDALRPRVVTPVFLDQHESGPRVVPFWAKRARGAMARFIVQDRLRDPGDLHEFTAGSYRFQAAMSSPDRPVFLRDAPA